MIDGFQQIGLWHSGDEPTTKETRIKLFYSMYFFLFFTSLIVGAFTCESADESVYLIVTAAIALNCLVRFLHMIWKKQEIMELLHRIGVHSSIEDQEIFNETKEKLEIFITFAVALVCTTIFVAACTGLGVPLSGSEKKQVFNVAFPFDWRTNDVVYWIEFLFIFGGIYLACLSLIFSTLTWYLLLNCALKYDILAKRLSSMGTTKSNKQSISERENENCFFRDLIVGVEMHKDINE